MTNGVSTSLFGGALTNGIQDISALLPLLGTEQCEIHVGSALSGGFFYASATSLSLFGILGIAKAGIKTLIVSINVSFWRWRLVGSVLAKDAGLEPSGKNLALIMVETGGKKKCHPAETQITAALATHHIEDVNKIRVESNNGRTLWNVLMMICTAIACIFSFTPYVYLNIRGGNSDPNWRKWLYPVIKAVGCFFTTTTIQFIIQIRLLAIVNSRLIFMSLDPHVQNAITHGQLDREKLQWDPNLSSEECIRNISSHIREASQRSKHFQYSVA
jgi:hypothetical protein